MTALHTSIMSLYEVSGIVPGLSFRARDLIRGGEPVFVSERAGTQALREWDRIAARLVPRDDRTTLTGAMLPSPWMEDPARTALPRPPIMGTKPHGTVNRIARATNRANM